MQLIVLLVISCWISLLSFNHLFPLFSSIIRVRTDANDNPHHGRYMQNKHETAASFIEGWENLALLKPTPFVMHGAHLNFSYYPPLGDYLGYDFFMKNFDNGKVQWEPETFKVFDLMITKLTTHIDFGTWIGPTVLYASTKAARVIGLECDPLALMSAQLHVRANPLLAHKISIAPLCVSGGIETTTMSGFGGSGSTIYNLKDHFEETKKVPSSKVWDVQCVPLNYVLESQRINGDIFMKIDTEGAEIFILPQILTWIKRYKPKPSIYISFHNNFSNLKNHPDAVAKIIELFRLYHYAVEDLYKNGNTKLKLGTDWTSEDLLRNDMPDILLTNHDLLFMMRNKKR